MQDEIWKNTECGGYMVSNKGRVKNKRTEKLLKPRLTHGYLFVDLWNKNKGKHKYIHRLVAQAFISNPENRPQVNHKNGNKKDNRAENLEWCSAKYNNRHSRVVLKNCRWQGKHILCVETGDVFESTKDFERKTNRCSAAIRRVLCGQAKTSCGYHWEYTDKPTTNIDARKYKYTYGVITKIAKNAGISPELYYWRKKNGWSMYDILHTPANLANRYLRTKHNSKE